MSVVGDHTVIAEDMNLGHVIITLLLLKRLDYRADTARNDAIKGVAIF